MIKDKEQFLGHIALLAASILWSVAYVIIRDAIRFYQPGSMALLRYIVASLFLLIVYLISRQKVAYSRKVLLPVIVLGIIGFSIYNVALNTAEQKVSSGCAGFIIGQVPVISAVLAVVLWREKLSWLGWTGFFISCIGTILIAHAEGFSWQWDYAVMALFTATLLGSFYVVLQKPLLKKIQPFHLVMWAMWGGTIILLVYLPQLIIDVQKAPALITFWIVINGIFPGAIAYVLWSYGLAKIPISIAVSYLYFTPLLTVLIAWFTLHEIPHVLELIGGVVAIVGAMLVNRSRFSKV